MLQEIDFARSAGCDLGIRATPFLIPQAWTTEAVSRLGVLRLGTGMDSVSLVGGAKLRTNGRRGKVQLVGE